MNQKITQEQSFMKIVSTLMNAQGKTIAIEGNIGSGKSTLLEQLSHWPILNVIQEDVESWKKEGWLELFYSDIKRYSGTFQLRTQLSHIENRKKFKPDSVNVVERSPLSNKYIFGQMLKEDGFLHEKEYDIIGKVNEIAGWTPDIVVILLCDPDVCYQRIKKRGREGENIPSIDYLKALHKKHLELKNYVDEKKLYYIDTTKATPEDIETVFMTIFETAFAKKD
jgi:deoxyadenosine/deoxycytidine kinase